MELEARIPESASDRDTSPDGKQVNGKGGTNNSLCRKVRINITVPRRTIKIPVRQAPFRGIRTASRNIGRNRISREEENLNERGSPLHSIHATTSLVKWITVATLDAFDAAAGAVEIAIEVVFVGRALLRVGWGLECALAGCVKGHEVLGVVGEGLEDVDFAVWAGVCADCPAVGISESAVGGGWGPYKPGHDPQSLPGMCAKSPMRRPWRKSFSGLP